MEKEGGVKTLVIIVANKRFVTIQEFFTFNFSATINSCVTIHEFVTINHCVTMNRFATTNNCVTVNEIAINRSPYKLYHYNFVDP